MKKTLFIFLIVFSFMSCSRSLYYIYDEDGSREGYPKGYCTFEVNRKKELVKYRGYSEVYADPDRTLYAPKYMYAEGDGGTLTDEQVPVACIIKWIQIPYVGFELKGERILNHRNKTIHELSPDDYYMYPALWYEQKNDSILLTQGGFIEFTGYGAIDWFPPYLKKAKKIDYNRFEKETNLKMNFKEPRKTKPTKEK